MSFKFSHTLSPQHQNQDFPQFPLPTRPPMFCFSPSSAPALPQDRAPSEQFPQQAAAVAAESEGEVVDELLVILKECLEEVSTKSRKLLLGKFFDEVEKEISLQLSKSRAESEFIKKFPAKLEEMNVPKSTERGLGVESSPVLERFKIRTPNLGGVVKEEPKGNTETKPS